MMVEVVKQQNSFLTNRVETRGLILRNIPYSDSSRIIRCLTNDQGILPFFIRTSKSQKQTGHLQTGSFIEFSIHSKKQGISTILESRPDTVIHSNELHKSLIGVWLFTIELINKAVPEAFHIPGLSESIDKYYTHLSHHSISPDPIIPLIILTRKLGIYNEASTLIEQTSELGKSLDQLLVPYTKNDTTSIQFNSYLQAFQLHFNIERVESLYLI